MKSPVGVLQGSQGLPLLYNMYTKEAVNSSKLLGTVGTTFLFSGPNKLGRYENVNRTRPRREVCIKKYVLEIIGSAVGAVYNILLPCSSNYVGQTGRRHKDYLRKHAQTLDTRWGSNVAIDAALCSCISSFEQ